jgi:WhiB family redox-sensing transcriptional regulator
MAIVLTVTTDDPTTLATLWPAFAGRAAVWTVDLLHVEAPDWREVAACRGADPKIFFPERGASTEPARAVCRRCPVTIECLGYALDHGEKLGIWGGLSERQRRSVRSSWVRR